MHKVVVKVVEISLFPPDMKQLDIAIDIESIPKAKREDIIQDSVRNWKELTNLGKEKFTAQGFVDFFNATEDYQITLVEDGNSKEESKENVKVDMKDLNLN